jgi:hypothetical protein
LSTMEREGFSGGSRDWYCCMDVSKNDLSVYDDTSVNLKFALCTNSSTRIFV